MSCHKLRVKCHRRIRETLFNNVLCAAFYTRADSFWCVWRDLTTSSFCFRSLERGASAAWTRRGERERNEANSLIKRSSLILYCVSARYHNAQVYPCINPPPLLCFISPSPLLIYSFHSFCHSSSSLPLFRLPLFKLFFHFSCCSNSLQSSGFSLSATCWSSCRDFLPLRHNKHKNQHRCWVWFTVAFTVLPKGLWCWAQGSVQTNSFTPNFMELILLNLHKSEEPLYWFSGVVLPYFQLLLLSMLKLIKIQ